MRLLALMASMLTGQAGAQPAPAPPRQASPVPPPVIRIAPPPPVRPAPPAPPSPPSTPQMLYADPPSPGAPPPVRARPAAPLQPLFREADYPAAALRKRLAGRARVMVEVSADGRALRCWVTGSSGAHALDQATCRILLARARFVPARDARGRPARDFQAAAIVWTLPAAAAAPPAPATGPSRPAARPPVVDFLDPPPEASRGNPARRARPRSPLAGLIQVGDYPLAAYEARQQGDVALSVAIDRQGRVTRCEVLRSSGSASLDSAACRIVRERARYEPARTAKGDAVPDTDAATLAWRIEGQRPDAPPVQIVPRPPAPPPVRPSPPSPPRVTTPTRGNANLASYFSTDDYPAAALRAGEQGRVEFRLIVGPDGRVQECTITRSSNSTALDAATCRILRSRARFTPARDSAGAPVSDVTTGAITWVLPAGLPDELPVPRVRAAPRAPLSTVVSAADYPPDAFRAKVEGRVGFNLLVGADGRALYCEVSASSGSASLDRTTCALLVERARFTPARDAAGAAVCDVHGGAIWWGLPDTLPPSPGERMLPADDNAAHDAALAACRPPRPPRTGG